MSVTMLAQRTEFAMASGRNVNSGPGTSAFDCPVPFTTPLSVTSIGGPDAAFGFLLGDRYALSFAGNGSTSIDCAVVVRSDPLGKTARALVFEGTDARGALVQVVWSPGFDLAAWCVANARIGRSSRFYNRTHTEEADPCMAFPAGTLIDTPNGSRPVEQLRPGDLVQTRDGGPSAVQRIVTAPVLGIGHGAPVLVHAGVLGAHAPVRVASRHRILVSDPRCEPILGVREVLVAVGDLVDGVKIQRHTANREMRYNILLDRHEILCSQGLNSESMLLGDDLPAALRRGGQHVSGASLTMRQSYKPARRILSREEAALIKPMLGLEMADMSVKPPSLFFAA